MWLENLESINFLGAKKPCETDILQLGATVLLFIAVNTPGILNLEGLLRVLVYP